MAHPWGRRPLVPWNNAGEWAEYIGLHKVCRDNNIKLVLPQSKRRLNNWRPEDWEIMAQAVNENFELSTPLFLGGFSDGARIALRTSLKSSMPDGLFFHSGHFSPSDVQGVSNLPFKLLTVSGKKDWTAWGPPPRWRTNAKKLASKFYSDAATHYLHDGRHEWGSETSQVLVDWMSDGI